MADDKREPVPAVDWSGLTVGETVVIPAGPPVVPPAGGDQTMTPDWVLTGKAPDLGIARTLRRLAQAGGTPRATLAYALLTIALAAFVYAAWLAWGPAAAVAVGGVGALAWGGLLLFAETVPEGSSDGGS